MRKSFFGSLSGCQKKGTRKKKWTSCFVFFYVGERKRENMKTWKRTFQKKTRKVVFLGRCEQRRCFLQKWHFWKIGKHYLGSEGKKTRAFNAAFSLQLSVFGKWSFFCAHSKSPNSDYKNRGFSRHRGKAKMALSAAKVPFWEGASGKGPRKGLYYNTICDT